MNYSKTIKAYYFINKEIFDTTKEAFYAIKREGYIHPRVEHEQRNASEISNGVEVHSIAGDSRYAFFTIDDRLLTMPDNFLSMSDRNLIENQLYDVYGFVFDAIELITEHDALVGPNLAEDYNNLMCEIAREVDNALPRSSIDLTVTNPISRQLKILYGMSSQDESVPGVTEALRFFYERVKRLQESKRCSGPKAIEMINQSQGKEVLDLLIANKISIHQAIGTIEGGIYRTSIFAIYKAVFGN